MGTSAPRPGPRSRADKVVSHQQRHLCRLTTARGVGYAVLLCAAAVVLAGEATRLFLMTWLGTIALLASAGAVLVARHGHEAPVSRTFATAELLVLCATAFSLAWCIATLAVVLDASPMRQAAWLSLVAACGVLHIATGAGVTRFHLPGNVLAMAAVLPLVLSVSGLPFGVLLASVLFLGVLHDRRARAEAVQSIEVDELTGTLLRMQERLAALTAGEDQDAATLLAEEPPAGEGRVHRS